MSFGAVRPIQQRKQSKNQIDEQLWLVGSVVGIPNLFPKWSRRWKMRFEFLFGISAEAEFIGEQVGAKINLTEPYFMGMKLILNLA